MRKSVDEILRQRQTTHGEYSDQALIAQNLKDIIRSSSGYLKMNPAMREGVEMIAHKIARCCAGDPYEADHWLDVQGYAALVHARVAKPENAVEDDVKSMVSRLPLDIVPRESPEDDPRN